MKFVYHQLNTYVTKNIMELSKSHDTEYQKKNGCKDVQLRLILQQECKRFFTKSSLNVSSHKRLTPTKTVKRAFIVIIQVH